MEDFYKMTSSFDLLERSESGNGFFKVIREVVAIEDIRLVYILQYKGSQHQSSLTALEARTNNCSGDMNIFREISYPSSAGVDASKKAPLELVEGI
ncbi:uncharacterized protein N7469_009236 [Penicillium citrinum]|uniref:Uncharacterized protein n=1 Tax=Penicillium citrinum TaxID=5077 RepID=A0A9W9THJ8_PENCI|nr:uncharacterized protein N7469_009236 [Penicillium citrinum]KAJ5222996.1 hypothetical protein N7469_009236 [Penicillium citrinum]